MIQSSIRFMSESKRKGTHCETAVVSFLRTAGFPYAERLALQGAKDRGDVTGIPGIVVECKNEQTYLWSSWLAEATVEKVNAQADFGIVAAKPRLVGATRTGEWMAGMYSGEFARLLLQAKITTFDEGDKVWVQQMSGANINRDLAKTMKLAEAHAKDAGMNWWVVEISPKGVKDPYSFYAVTSLAQMSGLLVRAGYGRLEA